MYLFAGMVLVNKLGILDIFITFSLKKPFVSLQPNYGQICLYGCVYEDSYWPIIEAII